MKHADTQKRAEPSDLKSSAQSDFETQTAQPLSLNANVLQLQRTIGNRATIQRLKTPFAVGSLPHPDAMPQEHDSSESDVQRLLQRVPMMTGDAMLEVAPYTTNIFGKKKSTAYNTLIDALKAYWAYAGGTKRQINAPMGGDDIAKKLDAILAAANAWWTKHGASTKASDAAKQAAVHKVRVSANKIKKDISDAHDQLTASSGTIEQMYGTPALWARILDWSNNVWHLEENTNFYTSFRTFTTVQQGREIIAKHLLDKRAGRYAPSPELFNVSAILFNRAGALILRPDSEVTVEDFRDLFTDCAKAATQVWGDLTGKTRSDIVQAGRDSFVFQYILATVPDITG